MKVINRYKKFSLDILVSVLSNAIPVVVLQFIVYPVIANNISINKNDAFLVVMSILHIIVPATGIALCNTRLLNRKEQVDKNRSGDYMILLLIGGVINLFLVLIAGSVLIEELKSIDILFIIILSIIWMTKDYALFFYRENLNFLSILVNNLILIVGFALGIGVFYFLSFEWYFIFLLGYIAAMIHILTTTSLLKERFVKTDRFIDTSRKAMMLSLSMLLGLLPSTVTSLILYPYGASLVSIYYSASIMGKILSMIHTPLSSVLVSYIVKIEKLSLKKYINLTLIATIFGILGYFVIIIVSKPILMLLYPLWSSESFLLVPFTAVIGICEFIIAIINPVILRFCSLKWQIIIKLYHSIILIVLGTIIISNSSLYNFAIFNMFLAISKVGIIFLIGFLQLRKIDN
jgi:O-antigen/teichoic acid export membrane protein